MGSSPTRPTTPDQGKREIVPVCPPPDSPRSVPLSARCLLAGTDRAWSPSISNDVPRHTPGIVYGRLQLRGSPPHQLHFMPIRVRSTPPEPSPRAPCAAARQPQRPFTCDNALVTAHQHCSTIARMQTSAQAGLLRRRRRSAVRSRRSLPCGLHEHSPRGLPVAPAAARPELKSANAEGRDKIAG